MEAIECKSRVCVEQIDFSWLVRSHHAVQISPVAKMISVRMVLAIAAFHDWKLWQLDVKNVFFIKGAR